MLSWDFFPPKLNSNQHLGFCFVYEGGKIQDYQGDYEVFLEKSAKEAKKIEELEKKQREIEKNNIKVKHISLCVFQIYSDSSLFIVYYFS